jgi:hypothetical protein
MLAAMARHLACLRERDQIVLVYSGWGTVFPFEWFDPADFLAGLCTTPEGERPPLCAAAMAADADGELLTSLANAIGEAVERWTRRAQPLSNYLPGSRQHVLIGSGSRASDRGAVARLDGLTASDLSNFVTRVRNRGADAFLIIDTRLAANGDLLALQQQAAAPAGFAVYGNTMLEQGGFPAVQDEMNRNGPVVLFGTGDYAVLYASTPQGQAYEYQQGPDSQQLGALIFRVAEAFRSQAAVKFRDMTLAVAKSFAQRNDAVAADYAQEPVFMASNLDLAFLAPRAGGKAHEGEGIEIIAPAPTRGATGIEEATFTVIARYTGTAPAAVAIVDGEIVAIDGNGQFRGEVNDAALKFSVALRVLGANYETLAARELKIRERPAEPVIAAPARRLALIIANDTYEDPAFPTLATPMADAEALRGLLEKRFGFSTRLEADGGAIDLFLHNATKAQIQQSLFDLRRRLTADDQLLIYYAGHGENDPDLGAYWVPVDGQPKADFTWVDANEITRELKRMNAASILVVSDSCYAGGLARGGAAASEAGQRERYLARASRLRSRQLMASGGEEPVADGGGGGHSVFAKALLEALSSMPDAAFTASEVFEQKVKPAVLASGSALVEGQIPSFSRIAKAGDEPSSEFVFQVMGKSP